MRVNRKLILVVVSFLLMIPFRLPISVILIKLFNVLAQLEGTSLPTSILLANVTVTKIVYNIVLSTSMVYNIEQLSRNIKKRKSSETMYWWTALILAALIGYVAFDGFWTVELFEALNK